MNKEQKTKGNNGCLKGCGCLSVLALLSAVALPACVDTRPKLNLKKVYFTSLNRGIEECLDLLKLGKSTYFLDSVNFSRRSMKSDLNWRFQIIPSDDLELGGDTCFAAKAIPIMHQSDTWFEIKYNLNTGTISRTCGDATKNGCNEDNTWDF